MSKMLKAEIITIGNEVITGLIQDTNSRAIATRLNEIGVWVSRFTTIGDDKEAIAGAIRNGMSRSDVIVITGGLGATHDDITKQVLVEVFGSKLVPDEKVRSQVKGFFTRREREVPESALTQADVPDNATILYNEQGTAPGMLFEKEGARLYSLPGVPHEMQFLLEKYLVPQLRGENRIIHRILSTTGIAESALWEKVGSLAELEQSVTVASLPSHLGVRIRLTASGNDKNILEETLTKAEHSLREKIGKYIFGVDSQTLEETVGRLLTGSGRTVSVAESCTGGLIGYRLTHVSGSSGYFMEGAITYSNEAKVRALGVDKALIEQKGAVSEEVARSMVEGACRNFGTDVAIAVTGIAGPGGGTDEKPVGLTYIAVGTELQTHCRRYVFSQDRLKNRDRAAQAGLDLLRRFLIGTIDE